MTTPFGARPLARVIQDNIKKPLADEILFGKLKNGGTVRVLLDRDTDKLAFEFITDAAAAESLAAAEEAGKRLTSAPEKTVIPACAGMTVFLESSPPKRKRLADRHAQGIRNPEGRLQRRRIFVLLDCVDGLPRDADLRREFCLRHLSAIEAQAPDGVLDHGQRENR